jgi:hypothetical protein
MGWGSGCVSSMITLIFRPLKPIFRTADFPYLVDVRHLSWFQHALQPNPFETLSLCLPLRATLLKITLPSLLPSTTPISSLQQRSQKELASLWSSSLLIPVKVI